MLTTGLAAPRMVVTDLDGTLLDSSGSRVSERNAAALRRAGAAGARVVVATGRPVWWLGPIIDAGFDGIAVCMNGAVVYDIGADEVLSARVMTADTMQSLVRRLEQRGLDFSLAVERIGTNTAQAWCEPGYDHPWGLDEQHRIGRQELLSEPGAKLLIRCRADSGRFAEEVRRSGITDIAVTYSSDDGLVEVAAEGVNKGAALDRLAREWGIAAEDCVAFGDMPNDTEMVAWAGRGIAMGNAHPDVLAVAGEQAPHHDADGVAVVLERWF